MRARRLHQRRTLIVHPAKLQTVSDLLLKKPVDLAKKCRIPAREMETIVNMVCKELYQPPTLLRDVANVGEEKFTTGESHMDKALGGGVRTGFIWEISGEKCVIEHVGRLPAILTIMFAATPGRRS